jgi:hypothetical protein
MHVHALRIGVDVAKAGEIISRSLQARVLKSLQGFSK